MDVILALELLALGCATGFLAGLMGIGGGMVLVPLLTLLLGWRGFGPDVLVKVAIATSLASICFTSVVSVRAHHRRGAVDWSVALVLVPGVVLGSLAGAHLAKVLTGAALAGVFAVFVAFSATQMFLDRKPKPARQLPQGPAMLGAGGVIGGLSALVGAGGGFISVPFMTWCNVPMHRAVGTSSALGLPIALAGTAGYMLAGRGLQGMPAHTLGFVHWPTLLLVSAASVFMAPLGVAAAHRLNVRQLKRVFAVVLYLLALYMAGKTLA